MRTLIKVQKLSELAGFFDVCFGAVILVLYRDGLVVPCDFESVDFPLIGWIDLCIARHITLPNHVLSQALDVGKFSRTLSCHERLWMSMKSEVFF